MSQKAWPRSDDLNVNWAPTPLWPNLSEPVADDATFVASSPDPVADVFQVKLDRLAWPSAGAQTLTVRLQATEESETFATVKLLEGGRAIASTRVALHVGFTDATIALSDAQKASISNYADLHVSVAVATPVVTSCCPQGVPSVLYCDIEFAYALAPTFRATITLVYDGSLYWVGSTDINGSSTALKLYCVGNPPYWHQKLFCGGVEQLTTNAPLLACSPFGAGGTFSTDLPDCCNVGVTPGGVAVTMMYYE